MQNVVYPFGDDGQPLLLIVYIFDLHVAVFDFIPKNLGQSVKNIEGYFEIDVIFIFTISKSKCFGVLYSIYHPCVLIIKFLLI